MEWTDIVAISASGGVSGCIVGLKKDGTVISTSDSYDVSGWKNIVSVSYGYDHLLGLKKDGKVVVAKHRIFGEEYDVSGWKSISDISAGSYHAVGLRKDGTVVAVGENDDGESAVAKWKNIKIRKR